MTKTVSVSTNSQAIWSRPSTMKAANSPASIPHRNEARSSAPIERPEGQRKPRQRKNLAGMLDAPRRRAAIGEGQRRDQPAGGAPAAIAEIKHPADAAQGQHQEADRVGLLEGRLANERRQQQKGRREDQRLRIGDLRHAGKDIRRPEGRLAVMQGMGEERRVAAGNAPWNPTGSSPRPTATAKPDKDWRGRTAAARNETGVRI